MREKELYPALPTPNRTSGGKYLLPINGGLTEVELTAFKDVSPPFPLVVMNDVKGVSISDMPQMIKDFIKSLRTKPRRETVFRLGMSITAFFGAIGLGHILADHVHAAPNHSLAPDTSFSFGSTENNTPPLLSVVNQPPQITTRWEPQGSWPDSPRYGWLLWVHLEDHDGGVSRWYLEAIEGTGGTSGQWSFNLEPQSVVEFGQGFFNDSPCIQAFVAAEDSMGARSIVFTPRHCITEDKPLPTPEPSPPELTKPIVDRQSSPYNVHVPWGIPEDHIRYISDGRVIDEDIVNGDFLWYGAAGIRSDKVTVEIRRKIEGEWILIKSKTVNRMMGYKDTSISYQDTSWPFFDPKTDPPRQ